MRKNALRKIFSAALALSLVIAMMPVMNASAMEIGDTITLGFNINLYKVENTSFTASSLTDEAAAVALSEYYKSGTYNRNWKYFIRSWKSGAGNLGYSSGNGFYSNNGAIGNWVAIKVKGFDAATYNINIYHVGGRGCVNELYILDNATYGEKDATAIDTALNSYIAGESVDGIQKVGEADLYGRVGSYSVKDSTYSKTTAGSNLAETEFGNAKFSGDAETEHILLFRIKEAGRLDGDETAPVNGSNYRTSELKVEMHALSFTKTTDSVEKSDIFGDYAAFVEHTEDGAANLYLISAIESLNYSKVGFELSVDGTDVDVDPTTNAYTSLTLPAKKVTDTSGNTSETTLSYTAENFGLGSDAYLYVVKTTLSGGFTGQTINFTPYAVKGEEEITGSTYQATLKK